MRSRSDIRAETIAREEKVLNLRKAGASFQAIAMQLGFKNSSGAHQAFVRAMKRSIIPHIDEIRDTELARLESLQLGLWSKAQSGDSRAAEVIIKIMERRAKLLGLDAPVRSTVTVITEDLIDAEIARLEAELARLDKS